MMRSRLRKAVSCCWAWDRRAWASSRARLAAEQGRTDEYLHAMEELYGIGAPVDINPNAMEELTCPVTNLKVCDLETVHKVSEAV